MGRFSLDNSMEEAMVCELCGEVFESVEADYEETLLATKSLRKGRYVTRRRKARAKNKCIDVLKRFPAAAVVFPEANMERKKELLKLHSHERMERLGNGQTKKQIRVKGRKACESGFLDYVEEVA